MNRGLPGWAVDLIRGGVRSRALDNGGDRAVWNALFKTACSASQRAWDRWEWEELVLRTGHRLGQQVRLKKGGRKERTPAQVAALLDDCWDKATVWVSERPPADHRADREAARRVLDRMADPAFPIRDVDRAVLKHAASEALRLDSVTPMLPRADIVTATGFGQKGRPSCTRAAGRGRASGHRAAREARSRG